MILRKAAAASSTAAAAVNPRLGVMHILGFEVARQKSTNLAVSWRSRQEIQHGIAT
jgi:hypothetical protein